MNALTQYTDVYREHADLLCAAAPAFMNARRPMAYDALQNATLPPKGSEHYETTDLASMLAPDYGINLQRLPLKGGAADAFGCALPQLSTLIFAQTADLPPRRLEVAGAVAPMPEGLTVVPFSSIRPDSPEMHLIEQYYGSLTDTANPIDALADLLGQDGVLIHAAPGCRPERPVQIVSLLDAAAPLMAIRRVLVVAEADAAIDLLMCEHTTGPEPSLTLRTAEIIALDRARVDWYDLEESTPRAARLTTMHIAQHHAANVLVDSITLYNGQTRNEFHAHLCAPEASLRLLGMAVQQEHTHTDNRVSVRHLEPLCQSDQLFKYVVDDDATGAFEGRIYVREGAHGTVAYQANRNIVSSPRARMYSKPQLEIYNDDVKCSHGTAIGRLDPMQMFYMRARGIPEDEARRLLRQAFMADVVAAVRLEPLRQRLTSLLERRFAGPSADCTSCRLNTSHTDD